MKKNIIYWLFLFFVFTGGGLFLIYRSYYIPQYGKPVLRIMTYSSFAGVFGPGLSLKKEFEKHCACRIKWIKVPDSTLFVPRLQLRSDRFHIDVLMGFDQLSLKKIRTLSWKHIVQKNNPHFSFFQKKIIQFHIFTQPLDSKMFVPYNWSPMTFLSRKKQNTLTFKDLLQSSYQHKISMPAPRTSTVGLQFLYWVWWVLGEEVIDFLKNFRKQLYGLPASWSTSYALFQRGYVDLSFSYLTSLLYHQSQKQKDFYPVIFKKGHPFQVEMAAISHFCLQCRLAQKFVQFLLTPTAQRILLSKNYMFPVISLKEKSLLSLSKVRLISYKKLNVFENHKEQLLKLWE